MDLQDGQFRQAKRRRPYKFYSSSLCQRLLQHVPLKQQLHF